MSILKVDDVSYSYNTGYHKINALNHVCCEFEQGRLYAIIGKSGSGKSTLLSMLAGLDLPREGEVLFDGKSTSEMKLDAYRRHDVAMIYQSFRLFPLLTAVENVMYPMELVGKGGNEARKKAEELIKGVGLPENVFNRYPQMLSGGEQQRVAIARALSMETRLMLADEPTGNLDTASSDIIIDTLRTLAHERNYCVIIVTHDLGILDKVDEVFKMRDGVLIKER